MKKAVFLFGLLFIAGCGEKKEYEAAILEQMKLEKDIQDYKINPQDMVDCVVSTSSKNMPGLLPFDPQRSKAYKSYAKMLEINKASDASKVLSELRNEFGSPKELAEAHTNYTESVMECLSGLVTNTEKP